MESYWIRRKQSDNLLVFVLGWGADHRIVEHIAPDGFDVLAIYDHRELPKTGFELPKYKRKYLVAWSFGVWVAEQLFGGVEFSGAVAFNGSPFPLDAQWGIEPRRMAITLRGIETAGSEAFFRRAYGEYYEAMKPLLVTRTNDELLDELRSLSDSSKIEYTPTIAWNRAIIGRADSIFPAANLARYWGAKAVMTDLPHYPFFDKDIVLNEIR